MFENVTLHVLHFPKLANLRLVLLLLLSLSELLNCLFELYALLGPLFGVVDFNGILDDVLFGKLLSCFSQQIGALLLDERQGIIVGDLLNREEQIVDHIALELIKSQLI